MQKQNKILRYAVYALLAILVSTVSLPIATPVKAQTTITVTVTPEAFGAGTVLLVSASGFSSGTSANIYISTNSLLTISSTDILLASNVPLTSGAFSQVNVTTPSNLAPGVYFIKVYNGQQVGVSSQVVVLPPPVPAITLSVTSGIPGTSVTVSGTNFPAGATSITIYFIGSSTPIQTPVTGAVSPSGTFSGTFTVPSVAGGNYVVLATVNSGGVTYGASAPFQVTSFLAPELTQWDSNYMPGGKPLYSVLAGQALLNLSFFGEGLPFGQVLSVAIYNSAGQQVTYGILPSTSIGVIKNGEFDTTQLAANGIPEVNVTIAGALSPGVGYYAVFTIFTLIGPVPVTSEPFIASVPTNGLFNACMSPPSNPYVCTSSASSSGTVKTLIQGYGFGANDPVTVTIVNGAVTLVSQNTVADPNGAVFVSVSSGTQDFPQQTANVVVLDHLASGNIQKVVGTYTLVPQFTVTDLKTQKSYGGVGDGLKLTGLSFILPFEATSITFTSLSNGYKVTLTKDVNGNPLTMYFSASNGNFPATSSGASTTLIVDLPALPGGNTSVVINGETTAGAPVSYTTYFWVNTTVSEVYYVNLQTNKWQPFSATTPQNLFSGDIIDVQAQGYPVGVQATASFSVQTISALGIAEILTAQGINIVGSTAFENGTLELILSLPNLPPSRSGFGPYTISLNNASSYPMLGQTIATQFEVNVLLPGQYSINPPHVYVNPQNIESVIGPHAPVAFPPANYTVGTPLKVLGVGFTGSAKEYVYISATVAGSTTYQLFNTVNTSIYGTFSFTMALPNESSYSLTSAGKYARVTYSVAVYQYNPSSIVQSPTTSTPTGAEALPFRVMPSITLIPDQGTPNTTVTVVGTGWASNEFVAIYMQTFTVVPPGLTKASSDGFFTTTFQVPAFAAGPVTVAAYGSSMLTNATAPFTVLSTVPPTKPTLNVQLSAPSTAQEGGSVLFTLTVEVNGTAYSVPTSSISGTILEPNGVTVPMSFLSVGTGQYQYVFAVPQLPGTYTATVTVTYDGLTAQAAASFYVPTPTTPTTTTVNLTGVSSALSSITSAVSGLSQQLTTLENDLTRLSSQTAAALMALGNSISALASSFSAINSHIGTAETYSLGALVIAFIALIVIIYGVFVRRMP